MREVYTHEGRRQKLKTELNMLSSLQHEYLFVSKICATGVAYLANP